MRVTQLLKKHNLAPNFDFVNDEVLRKKSERGTLIHSEIENFIKTGEYGFTEELYDYIKLCKENNLTFTESEIEVSQNDLQGHIDLVNENAIGDIKTSVTVDKTYISWQLSLYEFLLGKKMKLWCFHLGDKSKVFEVERVPREEILKLLECEAKGEIYQQRALTIPDEQLQTLLSLEVIIADCENRKKQAETDLDTIKKALLEEMTKQGIYKFENDNIKITKSDSYTRETIDSKKLKADKPDIYKEYTKTTQIKESLRVSLK